MEYADFVHAYADKSDDELLRLQLDSKDLTLHASAALMGELARRGIGTEDHLDAFREREKQRKQEQSANPGNLFIISRLGIGRWYFGKRDRTFDRVRNVERFRTTVFILLLWFPLIPTGSYLIEKRRGFFSNKIKVLSRLPLDWEQVVKVWAVAFSGLLVLIWLIRRM